MFKSKILESWICHQDFTEICEEFDSKKYMDIQRLYVLPYFSKHFGYDDINSFITKDNAMATQVMALFKEVVISMFGKDKQNRPNSSELDSPRWSENNMKSLANDIIHSIKERLAVPSV